MSSIFISYRRDDAEGQAGRLFEALVGHFGRDSVFMDVADIEPGLDFRKVIDAKVANCGVLLAIIGKSWLAGRDEAGQRRIDDPLDFVRLETASALRRDIPVIPVLVQGATMPRKEQLPADIVELAFRNAIELSHTRWESDIKVLTRALERIVVPAPSAAKASTPPPGSKLRPIAIAVIAAALAAGGFAIYQRLSPVPKDEAAGMAVPWSIRSDVKATITFVNTGSRPLDVYWVGFDGGEQRWFGLPSGGSQLVSTYVTHSWVVRDPASHQQISAAVASAEPMTLRVGSP